MTEQKSPIATFIELMVFAPIGAAVLLREQFPKLSQVGKQRAETQVQMARMVGQFAVSTGKKELERRVASLRPVVPHGEASVHDSSVTHSGDAATEPESTQVASSAHPVSRSETAAAGRPNLQMDTPVPDVDDLAIPGYNSLAASQVVERLPALSATELELVRRYEAASRHRRTILHRIEQLVA